MIHEEMNPAGVAIQVDPGGGADPAIVDVCGGAASYSLDPGDELVVTCSSVITEVIIGTVETVFSTDDETQAAASLEAGNSLTFAPETASFTAPLSNAAATIIEIDGSRGLCQQCRRGHGRGQ